MNIKSTKFSLFILKRFLIYFPSGMDECFIGDKIPNPPIINPFFWKTSNPSSLYYLE